MYAIRSYYAGEDAWVTFKAGEEFPVPGNSSFKLQVAEDTAYLCEFR